MNSPSSAPEHVPREHPRYRDVVVIDLGCEANQMGTMFMTQVIAPGTAVVPLMFQHNRAKSGHARL
jgi:hypothetical protein